MRWEVGMKVVHRAQRAWGVGVVVQIGDDGRRLAVRFAGRDGITVVSGRDPALTEVPKDTPIEQTPGGPIDQIAGGQPGPASAFALRARVLRLESLRRADSLGALLSSRIHVLPHQIGAAGRILSDRMPRFVLADEVGLGKTVEAGLVFAGMRQLGIAERVLVIVPEHLAFQWLAELFHKFN
ncbi:MAG TPA: helicase, partial [Anaeromyxobacteraceae bacterium]|nr:helicase [Anaeromyxobacteraceae bacterium]